MGIPLPQYLQNNLEFDHQNFALFEVKKSSYNIVNVFITPFILVFQSIYIYLFPCIGVTFHHFIFQPIQGLLKRLGLFSEQFIDKDFPHSQESLGNSTKCEWIRIVDLKSADDKAITKPVKKVLFDKVSPGSVNQGEIGDCWLLAAFATLCHRPEYIQNCFITRELNPVGKYKVRLFDIKSHRFVYITVDDFVPCRNGQPIYTRYKDGSELWQLILEKAYAKYKGAYQNISGGLPINALRTLTGYEGDTVMGPFEPPVFDKLRQYLRKGCMLAAASRGKDNSREVGRDKMSTSIVGGHAYSVLDVLRPSLTTSEVLLLKLRNPW